MTRRSTEKSWRDYDHYVRYVATGSPTMSKRPTLRPEEPCYIARGKGCRVWDVDGNEYIDFRNALGPITLGYCFPTVDEAIREQLGKGIIFGHPTRLEGEVAELLADAIPCAEKVRYLKTGGETLAAAIKVARASTGRDMILQCGYNGWINSVAAHGRVLPGVEHAAPRGVSAALSALHRAGPWADLAVWEQLFDEHGGKVAATVVAMDYADADKGAEFLRGLRALTFRHGSLLITDEIVAGFRVALGGLHELASVDVDMAVFSKGMANGMPVSALVGKAAALDELETAVVSSTFAGEALSLAAAHACIQVYREHNVIDHLYRVGRQWQEGQNALFAKYDWPLHSKGLASCPILVNESDNPAALTDLFRAAYRNGLSLYNVTYPTFSHQESDIAEALERLDTALDSLAG